jgi:hypothetical protein
MGNETENMEKKMKHKKCYKAGGTGKNEMSFFPGN